MKIKERRPLKKKQTKEKTINRVLLGLIVFLLAVIVISSIFLLAFQSSGGAGEERSSRNRKEICKS